jgi:hypothetical protein
MNLLTALAKTSIIALFCLTLLACAGGTNIKSDLGISGAPDWVNEGTQAVSDDNGRLIQGIGMAPPMGDFSLQKGTADNRARAEIARVLSSYIETTLNDYSASAYGQLDANVDREINSQTKLALNGTKIMGHWKNDDTGDIFSFAELDMAAVDKSLEAASALGTDFQKFYSQQEVSGFNRFIEEKQ